MTEENSSEIQKKVTRKRRIKMAFLTLAVVLALLFLVGLVIYLLYFFQIKPAKEKVNKASQITEFLDFYDREIAKKELQEVQEIMKEDETIFIRLKNEEFNGEDEYRKLIKDRIAVYEKALIKLQDAQNKINGYDKNGESAEIKRLLYESIDKRIEGYRAFNMGFGMILSGGESENRFETGRKKLEEALALEEKANEQFGEEMKRIFGEKEYQKMKEKGEIKGGIN